MIRKAFIMITLTNLLLYTVIFGPMAAGIFSYILGRFQKDLRSRFANLVTGLTFCVFLYLFLQMPTPEQASPAITRFQANIPEICGMG